MSEFAIEIHDLVKTFGKVRALDHLELEVPTGQVHGFLGPNGSGKTTTIRVLLGLLRADSGTARLLGGDAWSQAPELHKRLAYVPGDVNLWPNLTGGEAIDLIGRARGGLDKTKRAELIEKFDLDPRKKGRTYSKGNRQKVALVAALASDVDLLLLDEPTSGLDPLMERIFTDHIREENQQGRTILLSSHILSEVETLCDHVSIIKAGQVVETGTLADLGHLHQVEVAAELAAEPIGLERLPGISELRVSGRSVRAKVKAEDLNGLLERLTGFGVKTLTSTPPTLEELFLSHYGTAAPAQPPARAALEDE